KPSQVTLHVDVVERICEANGKLQFAGTRQQRLKRALRAHAVAIEQRWMGNLGPYEIVATVICRSDNQVAPGECLERTPQNRSRQMWAVAVEGNHTFAARCCEVCKHRGQAGRKAFTFLPHDI